MGRQGQADGGNGFGLKWLIWLINLGQSGHLRTSGGFKMRPAAAFSGKGRRDRERYGLTGAGFWDRVGDALLYSADGRG